MPLRRFKPDPVDQTVLEELLELATLSPSAKNDQPWRFVVLQGKSKEALLKRIADVLEKALAAGSPTGSLRTSMRAMEEAPVVMVVLNPLTRTGLTKGYTYAKFLVDTQSVGAAIQTLLLAAQSMGLGDMSVEFAGSAYS